MPRHEDSPEQITVEYTGPRFSFANLDTSRSDESRGEGPRVIRIIEYPAKPEWDNVVGAICQKGLIAGKEIESAAAGNRAFAMPRTIRPILHDAVAISSNPYTYDDRALFSDIGQLLRDVAEIVPGPTLAIKDVSQNLGIMKFSGVDDRRLFLIPGFEAGLQTVDNVDNAVETYVSDLSRDFGARFERVSPDFLEGFKKE